MNWTLTEDVVLLLAFVRGTEVHNKNLKRVLSESQEVNIHIAGTWPLPTALTQIISQTGRRGLSFVGEISCEFPQRVKHPVFLWFQALSPIFHTCFHQRRFASVAYQLTFSFSFFLTKL